MSSKTVIFTRLYRMLHRNVGIIFIGFFIISSILLRLSFSAEGLYSILLLILGVVFGLVILRIYKLAEENY